MCNFLRQVLIFLWMIVMGDYCFGIEYFYKQLFVRSFFFEMFEQFLKNVDFDFNDLFNFERVCWFELYLYLIDIFKKQIILY